MALTTLDPKTALVIIDLQKGIIALPTAQPTAPVVEKAVTLLDAFRSRQLPVVLVNVAGVAPGRNEQPRHTGGFPADWADLAPELKQQPTDHLVTKHTWGAFTNTDLEQYLKSAGVTQIVIAGIATSIGVESTARFASELGYNITFAVDAMADLNADAHQNSLKVIFPRLGETGTTQEVLDLLSKTHP
jgi:nicotinamidase-related amidase